jgi:hypothetical protein
MPLEPPQRNRAGDPGAERVAVTASPKEGLVDALDIDRPSCTASTLLAISMSLRAAASASAKMLGSTNFMGSIGDG